MKNFFSRFKNNLSADYGGRYIEVILQEILLEDVHFAKILFPNLDKEKLKKINTVEVTVEDVFKEGRRADLVIKQSGEIVACLEIKYEDKALDNQLNDYVQFAKKKDICFTYLTQYQIPKNEKYYFEKKGNKNIVHLLYSDVYRGIQKGDNMKYPVRGLFKKFLEDEIMMFDREFINSNNDVLLLLMIRGLHLKHRTGFGKKISDENISKIPKLWEHLIGNCKVLGARFHFDVPGFFKTNPFIGFSFQPWFDRKLLLKDLKGESDNVFWPERTRKPGGVFYFYSCGKIWNKNPDDCLYLTWGYLFKIDLKKARLNKYLFAEIEMSNNVTFEKYEKIGDKIPDEEKTYHALVDLMSETLTECLENKEKIENPKQRSLLKVLERMNRKIDKMVLSK